MFIKMSCVNPSYSNTIKDLTGRYVPISCGRCFCCRLDMQSSIVNRLYCAWKYYNVSAFVTFTYDDEHLRFNNGFVNPTLSKEDLHRYLDKIRHQLDLDYAYYVCGEYGDKFNRPHYHAIFFGLDYQLHKSFFEKSWKLGSVKVLPLTSKAFNYVTKYVTSSNSQDDSLYFDYGIIPPFHKYSRGLGSQYFLKYRDDIETKGYFVLDGRKIVVNRYYFNKYARYSDDLINVKERLITDSERDLSNNAYRFGLNPTQYNLMRIANLESQLSSRELRKNSKFTI